MANDTTPNALTYKNIPAQARAKALDEYHKYQLRTLSPVERAYIAQLEVEAKKLKGKK